jgi:hypothetical protein
VRDGEPSGRGVAGHGLHRLGLLLAGQRVVGVPEQPQRPAADGRGVERAALVGRAAEVDQPATRAQALERRRGRYAEERVEHQVDGAVRRRPDPVGQLVDLVGVVDVELDHRVRAGGERALLTGVRAGGADHARGAVQPGELERRLADHAAGAEHQHGLALGQLTAPGERHVRRDRGEPERGHLGRHRALRQRDQVRLRHRGDGGHAAVAGSHAGRRREPHRAAVDRADALDARHVRRPGNAEVRAARGAQQVERRDRRRADVHQRLARGRDGLGAVDHGGRLARGVQLDRAHQAGWRTKS